ncbi:hypothetical protein NJR55_09755 [Idiomarina sp. M1R2S28]|uniref:HEPN AbiU2-like domain-containing protein n=1 Tax=Idiomarina rhizosphaerae TaxID=2961572 RepID=A0A9X2FV95_9GAMM|nr:hypothetical protein [Idiomarina rhizosphaerae]MCP1339874.1 hypothetical protein [Idiomarina rhizosphaerae]
MHDDKVRTCLPSDEDAPEFVRKLYTHASIDFNKEDLDQEKLAAFKQLVVELCHDFTVYQGMFGSVQARNNSYKLGKSVMFIVERSMLTQICLRYAALVHDNSPMKDGKTKKGEQVVSFKELIKPLGSAWLNANLKECEAFFSSSGLKKWRNKVIAHNDLKVFKNRAKYIPKLSIDVIQEQLSLLNESLNYLEDKQYQVTQVEVGLEFGEGLDKYREMLDSL